MRSYLDFGEGSGVQAGFTRLLIDWYVTRSVPVHGSSSAAYEYSAQKVSIVFSNILAENETEDNSYENYWSN